MNSCSIAIGHDHRIVEEQQSEHRRQPGKRRQQDSADIVDDAAGAKPQSLEADRHGESDADLQRGFGEACGVAVDIAAVHGMANFHEGEQRREQDRRGFHRAQRCVVPAPAAGSSFRPRTTAPEHHNPITAS